MIEITEQMCDDMERASDTMAVILKSPPSVQFMTVVLCGVLLKEQMNENLNDILSEIVREDSPIREKAMRGIEVSDIFRTATHIADALIQSGIIEVESPDNVHPIH